MSEFPENWNEFICEARKAYEECKRDINFCRKRLLELNEKEDYLKALCEWIDGEESIMAKENLK